MICQRSRRSSGLELGQSQLPWPQTRALYTAPCCLVRSSSAQRLFWAQTLLVGMDRDGECYRAQLCPTAELVSQMSQVESLSTHFRRWGN